MILVNNRKLLPEKAGNYKIYNIFKKSKLTKFERVLRKIHLSSFLPLKKLWFNDWIKELAFEKYVIIFDFGTVDSVIKYIKKVNKNVRVILWYWNPVQISIPIKKVCSLGCELWSFDINDVNKYSLNYNTQFYCKENLNRIEPFDFKKKTDVFFCGTEKNRINELLNFEQVLKNNKINYYFHVVQSDSFYQSTQGFEYKNKINYGQYLYLLSKSKCVLDIVSIEQNGLTLRPLEALYFNKKLITNQRNIVDYDLYNKNNVFIIGVDDYSLLNDFVNSEYDFSNQKFLEEKYSFDSWMERFFGELSSIEKKKS